MSEEKPLIEQYRAKLDYPLFRHAYRNTGDISAAFEHIDVDTKGMLAVMDETGAVAFRHSSFANDGYAWFAELRYRVDETRVSVYFPFANDDKLDRPVEIRAERPVNEENIAELADRIARALRQFMPK